MVPSVRDALVYAAERWAWDDEAMIEELFEKDPPQEGETVTEWVDSYARHYDLIDPDEFAWR